MKNSAIRLIAALGTFAVGVALVALWLGYDDAGRTRRAQAPCHRRAEAETPPAAATGAASEAGESVQPVLAYCELVGNPERYDGKVVRVRATMSLSIHGLFFSDVACGGYDQPTAVRLQASPGAKLAAHTPVELIVVGRFEKVTPSMETDSLLDMTPLQFEIMRVEKVAHNFSGRPAQPTSSRN